MIPSFEQRHSTGGRALYRGSSSPDMSGQNEAARMTAALSKEQLDWAKQIYAESAPERAAATARANEVSDLQLDGTRKQIALGDRLAARTRTVAEPLEDRIIADANSYDSQARKDEAVGKAVGDVTLAAARARDMEHTNLSRMGVNPMDGAYGAGAGARETAITLGQAGAANRARTQVETIGAAKRNDAAALLRGLPGTQATAAQMALSGGNSSVGNATTALAPDRQAQITLGDAYSGARQGYSQAGNMYGDIARTEAQSNSNDGLGGIANLAMAGKYIFSDENMKTDRKPVKGKVALAAARKLPVENWKYKKGSPGDDGGKTHMGPMAQDANAVMGDDAAPGGKLLDASATGALALAAVKELDKGQQRLQKQVIRLADSINRKETA